MARLDERNMDSVTASTGRMSLSERAECSTTSSAQPHSSLSSANPGQNGMTGTDRRDTLVYRGFEGEEKDLGDIMDLCQQDLSEP